MVKKFDCEVRAENIDEIEKSNQPPTFVFGVILTFIGMLFFMSIYEWSKDALLPNITIWGSHIITIVFTTSLATVISYFVLKKLYLQYELIKLVVERKRAEEALRESEEKYKTLFENLPQKIFYKDKSLTYVSCNENYAQDLKINPDDIAGKTDYDFFPKELAEKYRADDKRIIESGKTEEVEEKYVQNGQHFFVQTVKTPVVLNEIGGVTGVLGIFWDITDRKRTEEALNKAHEELERRVKERTADLVGVNEQLKQEIELHKQAEKALLESEEKFRNYFELGNLGMAISSSGKTWVKVNERLCEILGYSREELLGLDWTTITYPEDVEPSTVQFNLAIAGEIDRYELDKRYIRKDGEVIHTHLTTTCVRRPDKSVKYFIVSIQDVTDLKRAESLLRDSEETLQKAHDELEERVAKRTAALSEANEQLGLEIEERKQAEEQIKLSLKEKQVLLAEIHHRVKNNLQVISSLLGMTQTRTDNPEAVELLSRAQSRVFTMALMHSQLYENDRFTDIDMGKHARQLILHLTQIYGKEKEITPVIRASDITLSLTYAVPCAMVLNELIANAFKHAYQEGEEGTIEVKMERSQDDKISLMVKDYGVGVPKEEDIDETACLGLKLARNLVRRQLKGHFQIRGDNGTEVLVDFQLLEEE